MVGHLKPGSIAIKRQSAWATTGLGEFSIIDGPQFKNEHRQQISTNIENKTGKPLASSRVVYSYVLLRYARDDLSDTVRLYRFSDISLHDQLQLQLLLYLCNSGIIFITCTPLYDVTCEQLHPVNTWRKRFTCQSCTAPPGFAILQPIMIIIRNTTNMRGGDTPATRHLYFQTKN